MSSHSLSPVTRWFAILVSGQWADDNERLCAMEPCLRLRRFHLEQGLNLGPLEQ